MDYSALLSRSRQRNLRKPIRRQNQGTQDNRNTEEPSATETQVTEKVASLPQHHELAHQPSSPPRQEDRRNSAQPGEKTKQSSHTPTLQASISASLSTDEASSSRRDAMQKSQSTREMEDKYKALLDRSRRRRPQRPRRSQVQKEQSDASSFDKDKPATDSQPPPPHGPAHEEPVIQAETRGSPSRSNRSTSSARTDSSPPPETSRHDNVAPPQSTPPRPPPESQDTPSDSSSPQSKSIDSSLSRIALPNEFKSSPGGSMNSRAGESKGEENEILGADFSVNSRAVESEISMDEYNDDFSRRSARLQGYLERTREVSVNSRGAGTLDSTIFSMGLGRSIPDISINSRTGDVSMGETHEIVSRGQGIETERKNGLGNGELEEDEAVRQEKASNVHLEGEERKEDDREVMLDSGAKHTVIPDPWDTFSQERSSQPAGPENHFFDPNSSEESEQPSLASTDQSSTEVDYVDNEEETHESERSATEVEYAEDELSQGSSVDANEGPGITETSFREEEQFQKTATSSIEEQTPRSGKKAMAREERWDETIGGELKKPSDINLGDLERSNTEVEYVEDELSQGSSVDASHAPRITETSFREEGQFQKTAASLIEEQTPRSRKKAMAREERWDESNGGELKKPSDINLGDLERSNTEVEYVEDELSRGSSVDANQRPEIMETRFREEEQFQKTATSSIEEHTPRSREKAMVREERWDESSGGELKKTNDINLDKADRENQTNDNNYEPVELSDHSSVEVPAEGYTERRKQREVSLSSRDLPDKRNPSSFTVPSFFGDSQIEHWESTAQNGDGILSDPGNYMVQTEGARSISQEVTEGDDGHSRSSESRSSSRSPPPPPVDSPDSSLSSDAPAAIKDSDDPTARHLMQRVEIERAPGSSSSDESSDDEMILDRAADLGAFPVAHFDSEPVHAGDENAVEHLPSPLHHGDSSKVAISALVDVDLTIELAHSLHDSVSSTGSAKKRSFEVVMGTETTRNIASDGEGDKSYEMQQVQEIAYKQDVPSPRGPSDADEMINTHYGELTNKYILDSVLASRQANGNCKATESVFSKEKDLFLTLNGSRDDRSLVFPWETWELRRLLLLWAEGHDVDLDRLQELGLLNKWKCCEDLTTDEAKYVENVRKRRRLVQDHYKKEFESILQKVSLGELVADERIRYLQLYARRTIGDFLSLDEVVMLNELEKEVEKKIIREFNEDTGSTLTGSATVSAQNESPSEASSSYSTRASDRFYREEFEYLIDKCEKRESVDENRFICLQLYGRNRVGQELTVGEMSRLQSFLDAERLERLNFSDERTDTKSFFPSPPVETIHVKIKKKGSSPLKANAIIEEEVKMNKIRELVKRKLLAAETYDENNIDDKVDEVMKMPKLQIKTFLLNPLMLPAERSERMRKNEDGLSDESELSRSSSSDNSEAGDDDGLGERKSMSQDEIMMNNIRAMVREKLLAVATFDEDNVDATVDAVMKLPKPQIKTFLQNPLPAGLKVRSETSNGKRDGEDSSSEKSETSHSSSSGDSETGDVDVKDGLSEDETMLNNIRAMVREKLLAVATFDEDNVDATVDAVMKLPKPQIKTFLQNPLPAGLKVRSEISNGKRDGEASSSEKSETSHSSSSGDSETGDVDVKGGLSEDETMLNTIRNMVREKLLASDAFSEDNVDATVDGVMKLPKPQIKTFLQNPLPAGLRVRSESSNFNQDGEASSSEKSETSHSHSSSSGDSGTGDVDGKGEAKELSEDEIMMNTIRTMVREKLLASDAFSEDNVDATVDGVMKLPNPQIKTFLQNPLPEGLAAIKDSMRNQEGEGSPSREAGSRRSESDDSDSDRDDGKEEAKDSIESEVKTNDGMRNLVRQRLLTSDAFNEDNVDETVDKVMKLPKSQIEANFFPSSLTSPTTALRKSLAKEQESSGNSNISFSSSSDSDDKWEPKELTQGNVKTNEIRDQVRQKLLTSDAFNEDNVDETVDKVMKLPKSQIEANFFPSSLTSPTTALRKCLAKERESSEDSYISTSSSVDSSGHGQSDNIEEEKDQVFKNKVRNVEAFSEDNVDVVFGNNKHTEGSHSSRSFHFSELLDDDATSYETGLNDEEQDMAEIRDHVRQKLLSSTSSFDDDNVDAAVDKVMKLPKPQIKSVLENPLPASMALTEVAAAKEVLERTEETMASMNRIRMLVRESLLKVENFSDDEVDMLVDETMNMEKLLNGNDFTSSEMGFSASTSSSSMQSSSSSSTSESSSSSSSSSVSSSSEEFKAPSEIGFRKRALAVPSHEGSSDISTISGSSSSDSSSDSSSSSSGSSRKEKTSHSKAVEDTVAPLAASTGAALFENEEHSPSIDEPNLLPFIQVDLSVTPAPPYAMDSDSSSESSDEYGFDKDASKSAAKENPFQRNWDGNLPYKHLQTAGEGTVEEDRPDAAEKSSLWIRSPTHQDKEDDDIQEIVHSQDSRHHSQSKNDIKASALNGTPGIAARVLPGSDESEEERGSQDHYSEKSRRTSSESSDSASRESRYATYRKFLNSSPDKRRWSSELRFTKAATERRTDSSTATGTTNEGSSLTGDAEVTQLTSNSSGAGRIEGSLSSLAGEVNTGKKENPHVAKSGPTSRNIDLSAYDPNRKGHGDGTSFSTISTESTFNANIERYSKETSTAKQSSEIRYIPEEDDIARQVYRGGSIDIKKEVKRESSNPQFQKAQELFSSLQNASQSNESLKPTFLRKQSSKTRFVRKVDDSPKIHRSDKADIADQQVQKEKESPASPQDKGLSNLETYQLHLRKESAKITYIPEEDENARRLYRPSEIDKEETEATNTTDLQFKQGEKPSSLIQNQIQSTPSPKPAFPRKQSAKITYIPGADDEARRMYRVDEAARETTSARESLELMGTRDSNRQLLTSPVDVNSKTKPVSTTDKSPFIRYIPEEDDYARMIYRGGKIEGKKEDKIEGVTVSETSPVTEQFQRTAFLLPGSQVPIKLTKPAPTEKYGNLSQDNNAQGKTSVAERAVLEQRKRAAQAMASAALSKLNHLAHVEKQNILSPSNASQREVAQNKVTPQMPKRKRVERFHLSPLHVQNYDVYTGSLIVDSSSSDEEVTARDSKPSWSLFSIFQFGTNRKSKKKRKAKVRKRRVQTISGAIADIERDELKNRAQPNVVGEELKEKLGNIELRHIQDPKKDDPAKGDSSNLKKGELKSTLESIQLRHVSVPRQKDTSTAAQSQPMQSELQSKFTNIKLRHVSDPRPTNVSKQLSMEDELKSKLANRQLRAVTVAKRDSPTNTPKPISMEDELKKKLANRQLRPVSAPKRDGPSNVSKPISMQDELKTKLTNRQLRPVPKQESPTKAAESNPIQDELMNKLAKRKLRSESVPTQEGSANTAKPGSMQDELKSRLANSQLRHVQVPERISPQRQEPKRMVQLRPTKPKTSETPGTSSHFPQVDSPISYDADVEEQKKTSMSSSITRKKAVHFQLPSDVSKEDSMHFREPTSASTRKKSKFRSRNRSAESDYDLEAAQFNYFEANRDMDSFSVSSSESSSVLTWSPTYCTTFWQFLVRTLAYLLLFAVVALPVYFLQFHDMNVHEKDTGPLSLFPASEFAATDSPLDSNSTSAVVEGGNNIFSHSLPNNP